MSPDSLTLNGKGNGERLARHPRLEVNPKRMKARVVADKIHRAEKKGDERVFI
jgi:hypothetical protein